MKWHVGVAKETVIDLGPPIRYRLIQIVDDALNGFCFMEITGMKAVADVEVVNQSIQSGRDCATGFVPAPLFPVTP